MSDDSSFYTSYQQWKPVHQHFHQAWANLPNLLWVSERAGGSCVVAACRGPMAGSGPTKLGLWSVMQSPSESTDSCAGKIRPAWLPAPAAPISLLTRGAKKPQRLTGRLWPSAPVYPSWSDASITMAAPQLQEGLRQLQRIIIRGTMKCPGHWQLICLWQSNISTREIKSCIASHRLRLREMGMCWCVCVHLFVFSRKSWLSGKTENRTFSGQQTGSKVLFIKL